MKRVTVLWQILLPVLFAIAACGRQDAETAEDADESPAQPMGAVCMAVGGVQRTPSAPGARVFFITPSDGEVVSSPVAMEFGITAMDVVPAGEQRPASGHHHLIVDGDLPAFGLPIPADERHIHFGDGRTRTEVALTPGRHTLQLLFADHLHIPHDPPLFSEQITVTVE